MMPNDDDHLVDDISFDFQRLMLNDQVDANNDNNESGGSTDKRNNAAVIMDGTFKDQVKVADRKKPVLLVSSRYDKKPALANIESENDADDEMDFDEDFIPLVKKRSKTSSMVRKRAQSRLRGAQRQLDINSGNTTTTDTDKDNDPLLTMCADRPLLK